MATPLTVRPTVQTQELEVYTHGNVAIVIDRKRGHAVHIDPDHYQYDYLQLVDGKWTIEKMDPQYNVVFGDRYMYRGKKTVVHAPLRRYTNRYGEVAWHWSAREAIDLARAAVPRSRRDWYTVG